MNFLKDSSTLQDKAFSTIWPGESDWIFMKILSQMYHWTEKSPLNFGGNPECG